MPTHVLHLHRLADDAIGLHADLVGGQQEMRAVIPDPADRIARHELLDVNRSGAFQRDGVDLLLFQHDMLILPGGKAAHLVLVGHGPVRDAVDVAAFHAVSRLLVQDVEADFVRLGARRRQGNRRGDQRQFQMPPPERVPRQISLLWCVCSKNSAPCRWFRHIWDIAKDCPIRGLRVNLVVAALTFVNQSAVPMDQRFVYADDQSANRFTLHSSEGPLFHGGRAVA